jgi:hypothetical protein
MESAAAATHSSMKDIVLNLHREIFERGKQQAVLQGHISNEKRKNTQLAREKARIKTQLDETLRERDGLRQEVARLCKIEAFANDLAGRVEALARENAELRQVKRHAVEVETLQSVVDALQAEKTKADDAHAKLKAELESAQGKLQGLQQLCVSFREKTAAARKAMADVHGSMRNVLGMLESWDLGDADSHATTLSDSSLFCFDDEETKILTHRLFLNLVCPLDLQNLKKVFNISSDVHGEELTSRRRAASLATTFTSAHSPLWVFLREGLATFWKTTPWHLQRLHPSQLMMLVSLFIQHCSRNRVMPEHYESIRTALGLCSFEDEDGKGGIEMQSSPSDRIRRLIQGMRFEMLRNGTPWSRKTDVDVDADIELTSEELTWLEQHGIYLFSGRGKVLRCVHEPYRILSRPARVRTTVDGLYGLDEDYAFSSTASRPEPMPATKIMPDILAVMRTFVGTNLDDLFGTHIGQQTELDMLGCICQQLMTTSPHMAIMDFVVAQRTSQLTKHHVSLLKIMRDKIQDTLSITTSGTTHDLPAAAATTTDTPPIRFAIDVFTQHAVYPCVLLPAAFRVAILRDQLIGPIQPNVRAALALQISRSIRMRVYITLHDRPSIVALKNMEDWHQIMDAEAERQQAAATTNTTHSNVMNNSGRFVFSYAQALCLGLRIHVFGALPTGCMTAINFGATINDAAHLVQMSICRMIGIVEPQFARTNNSKVTKLLWGKDETHLDYLRSQLHEAISCALSCDFVCAFS